MVSSAKYTKWEAHLIASNWLVSSCRREIIPGDLVFLGKRYNHFVLLAMGMYGRGEWVRGVGGGERTKVHQDPNGETDNVNKGCSMEVATSDPLQQLYDVLTLDKNITKRSHFLYIIR